MGVALITGASAGLGAEFARLFAKDKHDVVLVARRQDRLDALAAELSAAHGVKAHVIAEDLGDPSSISRIVKRVADSGLEIEFLVNNAGFGTTGNYVASALAREVEMVQVNIIALIALTHAFLPAMVKRGRGRVLNVGSTAGFQAGPGMANYYAGKAYVNHFTEALAFELRGTGVTATVSCPGPVATEFGDVSGNAKSPLFRRFVASSASIAAEAYRAMHNGRRMIVHRLLYKLTVFFLRLLPRSVAHATAAYLNKT